MAAAEEGLEAREAQLDAMEADIASRMAASEADKHRLAADVQIATEERDALHASLVAAQRQAQEAQAAAAQAQQQAPPMLLHQHPYIQPGGPLPQVGMQQQQPGQGQPGQPGPQFMPAYPYAVLHPMGPPPQQQPDQRPQQPGSPGPVMGGPLPLPPGMMWQHVPQPPPRQQQQQQPQQWQFVGQPGVQQQLFGQPQQLLPPQPQGGGSGGYTPTQPMSPRQRFAHQFPPAVQQQQPGQEQAHQYEQQQYGQPQQLPYEQQYEQQQQQYEQQQQAHSPLPRSTASWQPASGQVSPQPQHNGLGEQEEDGWAASEGGREDFQPAQQHYQAVPVQHQPYEHQHSHQQQQYQQPRQQPPLSKSQRKKLKASQGQQGQYTGPAQQHPQQHPQQQQRGTARPYEPLKQGGRGSGGSAQPRQPQQQGGGKGRHGGGRGKRQAGANGAPAGRQLDDDYSAYGPEDSAATVGSSEVSEDGGGLDRAVRMLREEVGTVPAHM